MATSCSTSNGATVPATVLSRLLSMLDELARRPDALSWNTGPSSTKREMGVPAAALPSA